MLFNSLHFVIFFTIIFFSYYVIAHKYRWPLLLIASYYFYMCWRPEFIVLILFSTIVAYLTGNAIYNSDNEKRRKRFLTLSLICNLGLLFIFKYFNFFTAEITAFLSLMNIQYHLPKFDLILPVGISFYTFQTLSYTIDVYRGNQIPEKNIGKFALFISFFPQLVAGPIERSVNLLPQFNKKVKFDYQQVTNGLKLVMWGLIKKVIIADRLSVIVNQVYSHPTDYSGMYLTFATILFTFQIFCDFSGYSDIAIGTAKMLGFDLMKNFDRPYFSKSIAEFWKRWHISLSSWFRDYLYISLGGNRCSPVRQQFNVFITFLISGLWHGANLTFVVWGALNGFYIIIANLTYKVKSKLLHTAGIDTKTNYFKFIQIIITFSLISFTWIFFRADTLADAVYIVKNLGTGWDVLFNHFNHDLVKIMSAKMDVSRNIIRDSIIFIIMMETIHFIQSFGPLRERIGNWHIVFRYGIYVTSIILLINRIYKTDAPFIYFQF